MNYAPTAAEEAARRNAEHPGSTLSLVTDPDHWAEYGIKTGYDLAMYLAQQDYRDAYKEAHGVRPPNRHFSSPEEAEAAADELWGQASWNQERGYEDTVYDEWGFPEEEEWYERNADDPYYVEEPPEEIEPDELSPGDFGMKDLPKQMGMGRQESIVIKVSDLRKIVREEMTRQLRKR